MLENQVELFLKKYNLLNTNILVAFSGGYDSMCLLDIMTKLSNKYPFKLVAIHLNHNWRGQESDNEEQNCKKFCKNIKFYTEKLFADIPHTETAAREARYDFFKRCAIKFNSNVILTAHNADDNAETVFYRLLKGTGITGLEGINEQRGIYYRPLLSIYRKDIEQYCVDNGLTPNNDSSNFNTKYMRNKIRHEIFPIIKDISPDFIKNINQLSKSAQNANEIINKQIKPLEKYSTNEFLALSEILQNEVVHRFLRRELQDYDRKKIEDCSKFIREYSSSKSGKTFTLGTNKQLFVSNKEIKLLNNEQPQNTTIYIDHEGEYICNDQTFIIKRIIDRPDNFPNDSEYIAYIEIDNVDFELRTRIAGDIIQPLGMLGTQKLKKYLTEKEIPKHEKDSMLFLCKGKEIFWVPGYGINEKIKVVTKPTHVIKLIKR